MTWIVNSTNAFQTATEAVFNKVHALPDAAIREVHKTISRPPKFHFGLNIATEALVVYIPQRSFSTKALMIDFGCVLFNNRFELATEANRPSDVFGTIPEPGIILEHTEIRLENLRFSRAVFLQTTVADEKPLVQPNSILTHS
ncbi:hypothetical protein FBUS_10169 [Fasciolopsis buskii]|uniref:Uncharacterized protein n=1 Tax=Fasciolopsis buskii TaxID=27845 RepID=A0A8E0S0A8_9TREM|nr:hypothetical protein FBUS_10169 [Fasciolopsis buski]